MIFTLWFLIAGGLLIWMALAGSVLQRLPLSSAMLYLVVGLGLGPGGLALIRLDPIHDAGIVEHIAELAVLISLFTAGLKLRSPWSERRWQLPVRLASLAMLLTVGMIALVGSFFLQLPLGAAILLGAILAPTDPVLASDVQVDHVGDRDRLRFSLTGEAGLNDGSAFPFVMLGLGLMGLHKLGDFGWRWITLDILWAIVGGLGSGWLLGTLIGRLVIYLRQKYKEAVGLDDFLALGVIALAYGVALILETYGFLAVFAAGLALRQIEMRASNALTTRTPPVPTLQPILAAREQEHQLATDPQQAPAYMTQAVLGFNEQLERIGEITIVVLIGGMLSLQYLTFEALWFIPLLLLIIRPLAVGLGTIGAQISRTQRRLIAWFGIRGIGSLYYLTYAIEQGLDPALATRITTLVLSTITVSIIVHGVSVTPLMQQYTASEKKRSKTARKQPSL